MDFTGIVLVIVLGALLGDLLLAAIILIKMDKELRMELIKYTNFNKELKEELKEYEKKYEEEYKEELEKLEKDNE